MRFLIPFLLVTRLWACHAVDGDRIQGRDLAAASPQFAALDPDVVIGSTPLPGVPRLLHSAELMHLAHQYEVALTAPVSEVCFERFTESLTPEKLLPVLRAALAVDDVAIEIEDFSRFGVPQGALEFPKTGLSAAGLWRGRVAYGENHSSPVWVKVRITTQQTWVEAARPLEAGKALDASSLIIRTGPRFPFGPAPVASIDVAAGRMPTRSIKSGEPIFASMLIAPREVERGDKVAVEVQSGDAKLSFEGTAESSARLGELVLIRNPDNGKNFQARVEGKGKVCVKK